MRRLIPPSTLNSQLGWGPSPRMSFWGILQLLLGTSPLRGSYKETCSYGSYLDLLVLVTDETLLSSHEFVWQDGRTRREQRLCTCQSMCNTFFVSALLNQKHSTHNTFPAGLPTTNTPCSNPSSITNMQKTLTQPSPISTQAPTSSI